MSLLRLPGVAATAASPAAARKIAAIISFTVVLPLLPVTATTGMSKRLRQNVGERAERAQRVVDGDQVAGDAASRVPRSTSAAAAPRRSAPRDEVVAVEALALQRDEQIAAGEAARIGRDARERERRRRRRSHRPRARRSPCPSCVRSDAQARPRRTARSEKGDALAVVSW